VEPLYLLGDTSVRLRLCFSSVKNCLQPLTKTVTIVTKPGGCPRSARDSEPMGYTPVFRPPLCPSFGMCPIASGIRGNGKRERRQFRQPYTSRFESVVRKAVRILAGCRIGSRPRGNNPACQSAGGDDVRTRTPGLDWSTGRSLTAGTIPLRTAAEEAADSMHLNLESAEREHILRVLRDCHGMIGGKGGAAERLGLKRTTLNSMIKKLGIQRRDYI
jgi:hypothetical protein